VLTGEFLSVVVTFTVLVLGGHLSGGQLLETRHRWCCGSRRLLHAPSQVVLKRQAMLICASQRHGFFKRRRILRLDVGLQWIEEAGGEDIYLMFLHEIFTISEQGQEFGLVVGNRPIPTQLDEFT
jgi:hypothetical protein